MSAATGARVALRVRSGLEAVDLGFAMARAWWRPLAASWAVLVLPLGALVVALLRDHPFWAIATLWWLRPAFARIPLFVLSQRLFGEDASVAAAARALPRLLRSGLGTSLFAQRFLLSRSFLQPVLQLEGLRGAARSARCGVIGRQEAGAAAALSTVLANLNGALLFGLLLLAALLTPAELDWSVFSLVAGEAAIPTLAPACYLIGISVFEPLLVAGGFGLYVSRRVFLEGWEIEIAFRRLAERTAEGERKRRFAAAAAVTLLLLAASPALAIPCAPEEPASAPDCIARVLDAPEFGSTRKELRWLPKERESEATPAPDLGWLAPFLEFLVRFVEILLWGGLALAVLVLAFSLRNLRWRRERDAGPELPVRFMGLDLDPRSLPAELVAEARACWRRGERIAALSLLYRGALVRLALRGALEIPASATEFECLRMIRRTQASGIADAFGALTGSWIRVRYAHEAPDDEQFEALCAGFAAFEVPA